MKAPRFEFAAAWRLIWAIVAIAPLVSQAQDPRLTPERLQELLKQYPDADANHDGVLTVEEAQAYVAKVRGARSAPRATVAPAPTRGDVSYGPYPRNILDFWRAKSSGPTPVVIYIHGGGFVSGDKRSVRGDKLVQQCLDAGVSVAAINYRYLSPDAPMQDVLRDCARSIQFIRSQASAWNIDGARVAC